MNRRTIGILIPTLKKGGAEKQAALLASVLKNDYRVVMIVMAPDSGMEEENMEIASLPIGDMITLSGGIISQIRQLYFVLKRNRIDTLFCYLTRPDIIGPIIGRMAGVKTIYQGLRNAELPKAKLLLEKIGNEWADGAIVNNYAGEKIFFQKGLRNMTVIPNCYPDPKSYTERKDSRYITVITVGRFVAQKDYHTAIAAVSKAMGNVDNLKFKIIGHGELEGQVRDWIKDFNIADRCEILINPKNIMGHLLDVDIYLSTSLFEGTSNSIMEALDASLPVVATDVGDNCKLVEDGVNGFLTGTGDVDTIANRLEKLAADRVLRLDMGREGNAILKRDFSMEAFKSRYMELLEV